MSKKLRTMALAVGASAALASAAPAGASAATPPVGTSVVKIAAGGWDVCAWFYQWKACAEVKYNGSGWTVSALANGAQVGASAGASYTTNPFYAQAQAAANALAKAVAAAAHT